MAQPMPPSVPGQGQLRQGKDPAPKFVRRFQSREALERNAFRERIGAQASEYSLFPGLISPEDHQISRHNNTIEARTNGHMTRLQSAPPASSSRSSIRQPVAQPAPPSLQDQVSHGRRDKNNEAIDEKRHVWASREAEEIIENAQEIRPMDSLLVLRSGDRRLNSSDDENKPKAPRRRATLPTPSRIRVQNRYNVESSSESDSDNSSQVSCESVEDGSYGFIERSWKINLRQEARANETIKNRIRGVNHVTKSGRRICVAPPYINPKWKDSSTGYESPPSSLQTELLTKDVSERLNRAWLEMEAQMERKREATEATKQREREERAADLRRRQQQQELTGKRTFIDFSPLSRPESPLRRSGTDSQPYLRSHWDHLDISSQSLPPQPGFRSRKAALFIHEGTDLELEDKDTIPYTHLDMLGNGGSASVEKVQDINTGKFFARKIFKNVHTQKDLEATKKQLRHEILVMRRLAPHHHIVRVYATYIVQRELALILSPVADGGDLAAFLRRYRDLQDRGKREGLRKMRKILLRARGCLAAGLAFMHKQTIRHKDIKPQNILIHEGAVLYTDFGISLDSSQQGFSTTTGNPQSFTRRYCAPEVAAWDGRNSKADIFSLGCVYVEIVAALDRSSIPDELLNGPFFEKVEKPPKRGTAFDKYLNPRGDIGPLISRMIAPDQKDRPSALQVSRTFAHDAESFCQSCLKLSDWSLNSPPGKITLGVATEDLDDL